MLKVVGIDIDNTLAPYESYKTISAPYLGVVPFLKALCTEGYTVCIWSCRPEYQIQAWIKKYALKPYIKYVNDSPLFSDGRKKSFHYYIGDDCLHTREGAGFDSVLNFLSKKGKFPEDSSYDPDFASESPTIMYRGTGERYLREFEGKWQDLWVPNNKNYCLLTICSHAKPYGKSYIHMSIRKWMYESGLFDLFQFGHISSAGIIPTESGDEYPFNSYDWDSSHISSNVRSMLRDKIKQDMAEWISDHVSEYLHTFIYLRENGSTLAAVREVLNDMDYDRISIVAVPELQKPLPYAWRPDPDDCLADGNNLDKLMSAIRTQR